MHFRGAHDKHAKWSTPTYYKPLPLFSQFLAFCIFKTLLGNDFSNGVHILKFRIMQYADIKRTYTDKHLSIYLRPIQVGFGIHILDIFPCVVGGRSV